MTSMAQKPVRERLAESLLLLNNCLYTETEHFSSPGENTTIKLSREDLANIVGTATETVIRLLSEFRTAGLIESEGRNIVILDIDGLRKVGKVYQ
jgi:CRP-like cAMP-binding protein